VDVRVFDVAEIRLVRGEFSMGRADIFECEAPNPPHRVVLSTFAIGVHPVTNAEYEVYLRR
jgi:formylglycine-generating enzyme required for sulfatase activity